MRSEEEKNRGEGIVGGNDKGASGGNECDGVVVPSMGDGARSIRRRRSERFDGSMDQWKFVQKHVDR